MLRISIAAGLVFLAGCSAKPTGVQVERLLAEKLEEEAGPGALQIENLNKVNGYQKSESIYVAQVEYDLVFLKSSDEIAAAALDRAKSQTPQSPFGGLAVGLNAMAVKMALGNHEPGDRLHREQEVELLNTEKGWRLGAP